MEGSRRGSACRAPGPPGGLPEFTVTAVGGRGCGLCHTVRKGTWGAGGETTGTSLEPVVLPAAAPLRER